MKQRNLGIILIVLVTGSTSCTDQDIQDLSKKTMDYANLRVGNYWIYEETYESPEGVELSKFTDSVFVSEVERKNGHDYFVLVNHAIGTKYSTRTLLRDSMNYLVDNYGNVHLTCEVFGNVIQSISKPEYTIKSSMHRIISLSVNEIVYSNLISRKEEIVYHLPYKGQSINHNQYGYGVGLIKQNRTFWTSGMRVERKLLRLGKFN